MILFWQSPSHVVLLLQETFHCLLQTIIFRLKHIFCSLICICFFVSKLTICLCSFVQFSLDFWPVIAFSKQSTFYYVCSSKLQFVRLIYHKSLWVLPIRQTLHLSIIIRVSCSFIIGGCDLFHNCEQVLKASHLLFFSFLDV